MAIRCAASVLAFLAATMPVRAETYATAPSCDVPAEIASLPDGAEGETRPEGEVSLWLERERANGDRIGVPLTLEREDGDDGSLSNAGGCEGASTAQVNPERLRAKSGK
jgi:hypothetical protein